MAGINEPARSVATKFLKIEFLEVITTYFPYLANFTDTHPQPFRFARIVVESKFTMTVAIISSRSSKKSGLYGALLHKPYFKTSRDTAFRFAAAGSYTSWNLKTFCLIILFVCDCGIQLVQRELEKFFPVCHIESVSDDIHGIGRPTRKKAMRQSRTPAPDFPPTLVDVAVRLPVIPHIDIRDSISTSHEKMRPIRNQTFCRIGNITDKPIVIARRVPV